MNDSSFLSKTIGDLQLSLSAFGDEALVPSLLGFGDRPGRAPPFNFSHPFSMFNNS